MEDHILSRVFRQKGKFPFIVLDNRISLFVMYRIHMHSKTDVHNCFHCLDFFFKTTLELDYSYENSLTEFGLWQISDFWFCLKKKRRR